MKRAVPVLILAMFLAGSALQLVRMVWDVGAKIQLDYGEGLALWLASQIFNLKQAFHPLEQYPHVAFNYAPFYFVTVRMVTGILRDPLISGRVISMAAALWVAGLFAWVVLNVTRGYATSRVRWFGAIFAGAWVLQLPAMQWVPFARVDMLALALEFTGLSIIIVRPFRLRDQIVAFFLLLLGLYTKQSLIAIPAASILLIALMRPVRAIGLACGLAAAGLAVLLTLAWATDGGVIRHWLLYNVNPFHLKDAIFGEYKVSTDLAALIALGLATTWLTFPRTRRVASTSWRKAVSARFMGSPLRRAGVGFGLATAFGFAVSFGVGKEGASINYCLDWQLALCPLTGTAIVLVARNWTRPDRGMVLLRPVLALLLGATALRLGVEALWDSNLAVGLIGNTREKRAEAIREDTELVKLISSFPGPVVSDNMLALLRAGKPIVLVPDIVKDTTQTGVFDENALVRRTSSGFFDAFILYSEKPDDHYSPRMMNAILQNYRLYPFSGGTYLVYVRR